MLLPGSLLLGLFVALAPQYGAALACTRDTYDQLPTAPVFPTAVLDPTATPALSALVIGHWSELAVMHRPAPIIPTSNPPQISCPHLTGTFVDFHNLGFNDGADVVIPENTRVLVSSCSIPAGVVYGKVTIPAGSELVFADAPIHLQATGIHVLGKLLLGSETCRLRNKVTITLHGSRSAQTLPGDSALKAVYAVDATVEMHGVQYFPTWTRLAKTINPGDEWIFVQDMVNWQVGQTIVVTTTELKDSRDYHRNEERVISEVLKTIHPNVAAIRVSQSFQYKHYGGKAYQAEVALLSRNIRIEGDPINSEPVDIDNAICTVPGTASTYPCNDQYLTGFGANVRIEGPSSTARFEGVEWYRVGQTNVLGRYPLHFHQCLQSVPLGRLYAKDCSVHRSYFRAFAIHGTNNVLLSQNVAYDVIGHAYFLEDGVEELNRFEYNFGALVHWLGNTQLLDSHFGAQYNFWVDESPNLILPSDLGASVYYITNPHNYFLGNAASGGFTGFGFVNLPGPVKLNENFGGGKFTPMTRPLLLFKGNTAHSTAYWNQQLGGIYVGGTLKHKSPGGPLTYTSGRDLERHTCAVDPKDDSQGGWCQKPNYLWMVFEDTKVFLANRGFQHWGVRSEGYRIELHDVSLSMNVFGTVYLNNILVNCRSGEHVPEKLCPSSATCKNRDLQYFKSFLGFQLYDVGQSHMLDQMEFRNCDPGWQGCVYGGPNCDNSAVFETLTHSHRYVPEIMQASRKIKYRNYNPNMIAKFSVSQDSVQTVSGRLAGWIDLDGSLFPGAFPNQTLILGSKYARNWWRTHEGCLGPKNNYWLCPKGEDSAASVTIGYDQTLEDQVMSESICPNGAGSCPIVAQATHFGRSLDSGLEVGQNAKVTGPVIKSAGGWYIKFNQGSPRTLNIKRAQIFPEANLVLAFPYTRGTSFTVKAIAPNWCSGWARQEEVLIQATSLEEVRAAHGDRWFYDSTTQVLYLRVVQKNDACFPANTVSLPWQPETIQTLSSFTRNGMTLMMMEQHQFRIEVVVSNCGGSGAYCAPVSEASVPPAMATQSPNVPATWAPTPPTFAPTGMPTPACVANWAQCGNERYTGCCIDPSFTCVQVNQWYKQCQQGAPSQTPSPTTITAPPSAFSTSSAPTPTATTFAPSTSSTSAPTSLRPTKSPSLITTANPTTAPPAIPLTKSPSSVVPSSIPTTRATSMPTLETTPIPTAAITPTPTILTTTPPTTAGGCAVMWEKCGGQGWTGPTCCPPGGICVYGNPWFWQCQPAPTSVTTSAPSVNRPSVSPSLRQTSVPTSSGTCVKLWEKCNGLGWTGPTCCPVGAACVYGNPWYSQCQPNSA